MNSSIVRLQVMLLMGVAVLLTNSTQAQKDKAECCRYDVTTVPADVHLMSYETVLSFLTQLSSNSDSIALVTSHSLRSGDMKLCILNIRSASIAEEAYFSFRKDSLLWSCHVGFRSAKAALESTHWKDEFSSDITGIKLKNDATWTELFAATLEWGLANAECLSEIGSSHVIRKDKKVISTIYGFTGSNGNDYLLSQTHRIRFGHSRTDEILLTFNIKH